MDDILISEKANTRITRKCCSENAERAKLDGYKECVCSNCGEKYLKYYSAKTEKCCSCREKLRLIKHGAAVVLRDGFPKKEIFSSYNEIQEYFSGDEIICLLCGNGFDALPAHLASIHNISADSYKEMFGLPLSRGLVIEPLHNKLSDDCKKRGIGKDAEFMAQMKEKICYEKIRPINRVIKSHCNARLAEGVINSTNQSCKRTNLVDANCSLCGDVLGRKITEYAVLVQGCNVLCEKCQRIKYLESQRKYAKKRKQRA